ncbi:tryptophan-rich sensory protein [Spirosoma utsteinense]|uniref:Tryptophan-rich sensory protein n=1 Tax=Spirosoma utsteinense TaxID=2585773 RepID=A0ABR6W2C1_9BACT|nr:tryptophan-rich sensory protein [Spirosoma utsteinense]MBC3785198.1 tryptophan-rich sensory protein [Spirosoma utsteinense]MBC3790577.1 tryptophan-rich sensory protein [Spirosoma utsteinense]
MKNSSIWRIATAVFAVGSILYTTTSSSRSRKQSRERQPDSSAPEYDVPVEYQEVFDKNLIVPAGWSFGVVWSTVYTGLGALLVHQALPSQSMNPRYQKALPWWLASWTLNAIFGRYFSQNDPRSVVISDLTTKLNLPAALALHHSLEIGRTDVPAPEKYLRIPVSLYAGWLTAATVVGTPNTLLTLGLWENKEERDAPLAAGILGATALAGYGIARHLNDPWYMLPFVAGFGGIASRQWIKQPLVGQTAATLALAYTGLLVYWLPKGKFYPYEHTADAIDAELLAGPIETAEPHQAAIARERTVELD